MVDTLTPTERSQRMSRVRGKDTSAELAVRRMVHRMGFRYRLHDANLPGKPDIVFKKRKKIIFVHGCFWHRHPAARCHLARLPKSRLDFWVPKLTANRERDVRNERELSRKGWRVLVVWECELGNEEKLRKKLQRFLKEEE
jgi:DNA mismatch endonuclease, patch repair protein